MAAKLQKLCRLAVIIVSLLALILLYGAFENEKRAFGISKYSW